MALAGSNAKLLPTYADIEEAERRIAGITIVTPLLESPWLNRELGGRLLVKAENLQVTGSFKLRGAANRLRALNGDERQRGVVARSSGNHGLAIAYCASLMGISAVVVAPETAPAAKIEGIRAYGATVLQAPIHKIAEVAAEITNRERRVFVDPADDPWVVAGQGTVGLEIAKQAEALGAGIDDLLVCCSGGGLMAGCVLALEQKSPSTRIHGVEAAGFEKMANSLAAGRRINLSPGGQSICDAITGPYMAEIPFDILKNKLAGTFAASDEEAMMAIRVAFSEFGFAVEPGGAVALAAVLTRKMPIDGKTVVVAITGRNVNLPLAATALQAEHTGFGRGSSV
ncbi:threonine/serine dehydratase [Sinorhizobium numidicum]|uniref:Threonine/serine dehydratase n=1 Tax=Sinorhizobium numidicum TaxID=680248 RepID=A0ABY8CR09_9HYPH|nr:threonine/serine dehydratase [Sinorhizobium numidicum]WEX73877.1 threonine/serine dehydratase [Sinorhizobium numidicum]WEX79862.1 threonine/serine dehydratase [Sinorhizobium numidicum]